MKTAVLLINLGTPDSPSTSDVRRYLAQFLNDPRVIDIPWLPRKLLVNGIIVPFRSPKSAKVYRKLWTEKGSPLLLHGMELAEKLQAELPEGHKVFFGMRYQNPSLEKVLEEIRVYNPAKIIVLPLFPHYASSSTGSALQRVMEIVSKWWVIPEMRFISQYYNDPLYIKAFVERGNQYDPSSYDHVLFSYHGLPVRQVDKVYNNGLCEGHHCEDKVDDENLYCYKATCYETTRLIAAGLGLSPDKYSVGFQSRLDQKWITPFSDELVKEYAQKGIKRLLVFSPAFVADCLETTVEIGHEYLEIFTENGGEHLQLVESLNTSPTWVHALKTMVLKG